jgi:hypothetical protein
MRPNLHEIYLHEMLKRLPEVHEDRTKLEAIITEIMLFEPFSKNQLKACDYMGIYPNYVNLIELKGSYKREKSKQQLLSTKHFVEDWLQKPVNDMKMVVYNNGLYDVNYIQRGGLNDI